MAVRVVRCNARAHDNAHAHQRRVPSTTQPDGVEHSLEHPFSVKTRLLVLTCPCCPFRGDAETIMLGEPGPGGWHPSTFLNEYMHTRSHVVCLVSYPSLNPGGRWWNGGAVPWRRGGRGEWTGAHHGLFDCRLFHVCQEGAACVRTRGEYRVKRGNEATRYRGYTVLVPNVVQSKCCCRCCCC